MIMVVGVRFENSDKPYYFSPNGLEIKRNDKVIVETIKGMELGTAISSPKEVENYSEEIKPIIRLATDSDIAYDEETKNLANEAFWKCKKLVVDLDLDMKVIRAVYTFDRKKLLFYFVAEDRVDFRQLVKELASVYRTRIELRQIGLRDATKRLGGIGSCGRTLCCKGFLSDFKPVSIKMLKDQNIVLNPNQISGHCGRLMCCLAYEHDVYEDLNKNAPKVGKIVTICETKQEATVIGVNLLKREVKLMIETDGDKEILNLNFKEITNE